MATSERVEGPTRDGAPPHALPAAAVAEGLDVDPGVGLGPDEVARRAAEHGPNRLAAARRETGLQAFLRQYRDLMQVVLVSAAVVSLLVTDDVGTTIVLAALTLFNAVLGLRGESKAQASLDSLQRMMRSIARVRRGGEVLEVDAEQLVPGDVVLVEAGNRVPADGRLILAATLEVEEAALTGESTPAAKDVAPVAGDDVPLGDRHGMVFMNTSVTRGRGEFVVTATGMRTEMGHVAELLEATTADRTPLQKQLDALTRVLVVIAALAFLVMLVIGRRDDQPFDEIFVSGVALAIAAIPCGLPAVVTTLYSMGTRVMAAQNAIVKRLPSVETLGSVSAICSDKTGTLTLNQMTAREFTVPGRNHFTVTGEGYGTDGRLVHDGGAPVDLDAVLMPMALCADAVLDGDQLVGDPTEGALIVLAAKGGLDLAGVRARHPRIAEVPFDSEYKFMATFHRMDDERGRPVVRCFVKGAPDVLIARGGSYWLPGGEVAPVTDANRRLALDENDRMARAGERVMVVARRDLDPAAFDPDADLLGLVQDLTLLAMVGIVDPPRPEARAAIADCASAGIRVRMITGDHAVTAAAIAHELGIEGEALTGTEFAALSDEELTTRLPDIGVVARVAPEDKIRLVDLLQRGGEVVAMTGDGVNDAPALKKADIGVAMGITGTEVSKDAAVMILTDDNFATIVRAVEHGRELYDNLSKYIRFQMAALVSFIASFVGAAIFSIADGTPFSPLTVLYINLVIQVPVAIALGFDAPLPGVMRRPPRRLGTPVLTAAQWGRIVVLGLVVAATALIVRDRFDSSDGEIVGATMCMTAFALMIVALGLNARSETGTAFTRDILRSGRQAMLFGLSLLLIVLGSELGFLQRVLGTTPLDGSQWLVCIGTGLVVVALDEAIKLGMRARRGGVPVAPAGAVAEGADGP